MRFGGPLERNLEKWVARFCNVREERGREWPVDVVSRFLDCVPSGCEGPKGSRMTPITSYTFALGEHEELFMREIHRTFSTIRVNNRALPVLLWLFIDYHFLDCERTLL